MVRVYIWSPEPPYIGHASISIDDVYVSFWPDGSAGWKDLKKKTSQPGAFMEQLADDIENEGGRQPITIDLHNIDEAVLLEHIADLLRNTPRYQLAKHNCSHVVADCLRVSSGKPPSFRPHAGEYSKLGKILGTGIWTPTQVLKYATELSKT